MGQGVTVMNRLNPFGQRDPEPPVQDTNRRSRSTRNAVDPNENGSPPVSERFFGTHFLMGGKRFDAAKPDTFLFGANSDLDYLGMPVKFPYGVSETTVSVLNALINIRRDSVRITKDESMNQRPSTYRIEFIYDCDVDCYIQIHYCAREIVEAGAKIKFDLRFPELKPSRRFLCKTGADQTFSEVLFKPHQYDPQKMYYSGGFWFPVVIEMTTQDPGSRFRDQSQITLCVLERSSHSLVIKSVKQKLITDGVVYLLQDVFGIENREANSERDFECSICKDNTSDTILLPCRHLCLCQECNESFLHNVKECPFCRSPVKALLTLDAVRLADRDSNTSKTDPIATERFNLIEILNGQITRSTTLSRVSSFSEKSHLSTVRNKLMRQEVINEIFHEQRSPEETTNNRDVVELQDIRITQ